MIESKICFSLGILTKFIDNALDLSYDKKTLTGFEYLVPLMEASAHNTYIETVSNKADSLYLRCKESERIPMVKAYLNHIKRSSSKLGFDKKDVILAFDYTSEDFYGDVQGLDIHGWTGERGIKGHFKFITCSVISDDIPEKIPLITLPIQIGHYKSDVILRCLSSIKGLFKEIKLILLDRGFYDKDLMYDLDDNGYPYLIFVPKSFDKKSILYSLNKGEQISIYNEFTVNKDFSKYSKEHILSFLKEIYDPKSKKSYDWVFATNVEQIILENLVLLYKKRWRIETQFRVQDEAKIKCKSKDVKIRYFLFLFEQILQVIWMSFYKEELSFKRFIVEMNKQARPYTKRLWQKNE